MKKSLSILAMAEAFAAPFAAFGRAMIGSQKTEPQQSKEEADANIAAAEAKRLRKQQKRVAHASH